MSENNLKKLPLGKQVFKEIIEENNLYVDKTEEIYNLINGNGKYFFLSRPRRFGKSLLISTLESIFLGEKELFKDLYIYEKIGFKKYPIIKITMNDLRYSGTIQDFELSILHHLKNIYEKYNIQLKTDDYVLAFKNLIRELSTKSDQGKVVLLIDEYDKPIIEYLGSDIEKSKEMRDILKNFYETIKANDEYIHFAFLTGVSKFSKTSIFSSLNNLTDITLSHKYSKIVGITEEQLYSCFDEYIKILAKKRNITVDYLKETLKKWYNGYSWDGKNFLYNPYSLLLLFEEEEIKNYWFETGSPSFLLKLIKEYDIDIKALDNLLLAQDLFSSYDIEKINIYSLLFQTGYLTIKEVIEYDITDREYRLSYPNKEVKDSLLKSILNENILSNNSNSNISISRMIKSLKNKDLDSFFTLMKSLFGSIPNQIYPEKGNTIDNKEYYYHTIFHIIFTLIGVNINSEISTSKGFVDSVVETNDYIYIFEFKLEKNSNVALEQIENKKYYEKYLSSRKEIILIGISFDIEERNIKEWKVSNI